MKQNSSSHKTVNDSRPSYNEIEVGGANWLRDARIQRLSLRTIAERQLFLEKLLWFMEKFGYHKFAEEEARHFLEYLNVVPDAEGRWGNPRNDRSLEPVTVKTYYIHLKGLMNYLIRTHIIESSPLTSIPTPKAAPDEIQPLSYAQLSAILSAALLSKTPTRDYAILLFMLDTGCRASELCNLKYGQMNVPGRCCTVVGKGNKKRTLCFAEHVAEALLKYLNEIPRSDSDSVFLADRCPGELKGLTRSGLLQLVHRLGIAAGIRGVRCSPHTFRHTFAVNFLKNSGNIFSLQKLLGHTSLAVSQRYLALSQADIEMQHRKSSPADNFINAQNELLIVTTTDTIQ